MVGLEPHCYCSRVIWERRDEEQSGGQPWEGELQGLSHGSRLTESSLHSVGMWAHWGVKSPDGSIAQ